MPAGRLGVQKEGITGKEADLAEVKGKDYMVEVGCQVLELNQLWEKDPQYK